MEAKAPSADASSSCINCRSAYMRARCEHPCACQLSDVNTDAVAVSDAIAEATELAAYALAGVDGNPLGVGYTSDPAVTAASPRPRWTASARSVDAGVDDASFAACLVNSTSMSARVARVGVEVTTFDSPMSPPPVIAVDG